MPMRELLMKTGGENRALLFEGDQLIANKVSTREHLRWFPSRVIRCRHEWLMGGQKSSLEVSFVSNLVLAFRFFEFRHQSAQITSGALRGVDLLSPTALEEGLARFGFQFSRYEAREQIVDAENRMVLQRVPVWKDSEINRGILDSYLVDDSLDPQFFPGLIEICRFRSGEIWKGYLRP